MEKKRILHIVGTMQMGGQETFIMNIFRNIDLKKYEFDFVVHSEEVGYYEKEIKKLGGKIYRITPISKNPIKHMLQLRKVIKKNTYEIMHRHTNNAIVFFDLLVGRICGVKKIIIHSHSNTSGKLRLIHKLLRPFTNMLSTERLACSEEAGKWLFGRKNFIIIPNAIDVEKFKYNEIKRKEIRNKENATNMIVIGHVGRFDKIKNHKYLIEIFKELNKKVNNAELWLIGDGDERKNIEELCREQKIEKKVKFFGTINNTYDYYQGMDFFVFPSIKEGLGIALIEAQVSGLNCVISNTIPEEAVVLKSAKKLSINENPIIWSEHIEREINKKNNLLRNIDIKLFEKYKIENLVTKIKEIYE